MSRTRRIYNKLRWKHRAERFIKAKYNSGYWLNWGMNIHGDPNQTYVIWAGPYCYHPYKQLCMGHCSRCSTGRFRENRSRRRKFKYEETYTLKNWRYEIDEYDIFQEED